MPGSTTTQQAQQQNSVSQPWAPTQPLLGNILQTLGGNSTAPTGAQQTAANTLVTSASGIPSFGPQAANAVPMLFGSSTAPQQQMLTSGYENLQKSLTPYASGAMLDPNSNPAIRSALDTVNTDVTNSVASEFAGAGRPLGTNAAGTQALARGIAQGEAPILLGQYNTNVANQMNAADTLFGGAGSTAGALTGQQQVPLSNILSGIGAAGSIPGLYLGPGEAQLGAAGAQYGLPYSNLSQMLSNILPIAGLGGQTSGTGVGTTTQQQPLGPTLLGGTLGTLALLGMFSDERVKDNVIKVGMLYDDTPVYAFTYDKAIDPTGTPRIGVMAQDVEKRDPAAVGEIEGVKIVDYGRVAKRAAIVGMLDGMFDLPEAA